MSGGRLLYSLGAADLKARNPTLDVHLGSNNDIASVALLVLIFSPGCKTVNNSLRYGGQQ